MEVSIDYLQLLRNEILSELKLSREPLDAFKNFVEILGKLALQEIRYSKAEMSAYCHYDLLGTVAKTVFRAAHFRSGEVWCCGSV